MMLNITLWDVVAFAAFYALAYGGPVLLGVAVAVLAVPALRRNTGLRRTAYGLLGTLAVLAVAASPFLAYEVTDWIHRREWEARTRRLDAPQVIGGVAFPAGSTVHVSEDGLPEFGSLPVATQVLGLPLAGDFVLGVEYDREAGSHLAGITRGTLAAAVEVQGVPCGPGPIVPGRETTRCTLARDWLFAGHLLAAGSALEVYRPPLDAPPMLRFGSLARAELLYDVRWPPGTVLGPVNTPPERMAHGPGPDSLLVSFCLPSGATADIGGAVLHGFLAYNVQGNRRSVSPVCDALPDDRVGTDGYAQVGPNRFSWGERPDAASAWQWTMPFTPED